MEVMSNDIKSLFTYKFVQQSVWQGVMICTSRYMHSCKLSANLRMAKTSNIYARSERRGVSNANIALKRGCVNCTNADRRGKNHKKIVDVI